MTGIITARLALFNGLFGTIFLTLKGQLIKNSLQTSGTASAQHNMNIQARKYAKVHSNIPE